METGNFTELTLRKPEKFPGYVTPPLHVLIGYSCTQFVWYSNMHGTNFNGNFEHLFILNEINISQT